MKKLGLIAVVAVMLPLFSAQSNELKYRPEYRFGLTSESLVIPLSGFYEDSYVDYAGEDYQLKAPSLGLNLGYLLKDKDIEIETSFLYTATSLESDDTNAVTDFGIYQIINLRVGANYIYDLYYPKRGRFFNVLSVYGGTGLNWGKVNAALDLEESLDNQNLELADNQFYGSFVKVGIRFYNNKDTRSLDIFGVYNFNQLFFENDENFGSQDLHLGVSGTWAIKSKKRAQ